MEQDLAIEQGVPIPALMAETPTPTPEEKKKRGRPNKTSDKRPQTKDLRQKTIDNSNIDMLLQTVFGVIALKAGGHWSLSQVESEQISKPLGNILAKYDWTEKANSISDPVALVMACVAIVTPRIIMSKFSKEAKIEKVIRENGGMKVESKSVERINTNVDREISQENTNADFIASLHSDY